MITPGYYTTISAIIKSRQPDDIKEAAASLITHKLAQKLWDEFEQAVASGVLDKPGYVDPLGSPETTFKGGVLSLAAWLMAELWEGGQDYRS